jgi:ketosteroid isomerase-like protein
MKKALLFLLIGLCLVDATAQSVVRNRSAPVRSEPAANNLQRLVDAERSFAAAAAERGTKTAFLTFLSDDGIIFNPTEVNGKTAWKARAESPALLAWNPAWADVSADGNFGYTTGGWELRPNGKTDKPTSFGEYVTIWQKQADGNYKALLDIGITHAASSFSNAPWRSPVDAGTGAKTVKQGIDNAVFTDIFSNRSMANGYFNYLAEDVVVLRDGHLPFYGKQNAFFALEKLDHEFPPSAFLDFNVNTSKVFGNMMYVWGVYQLTEKDKSVKKWNFVQIWKNRRDTWQIVLDIFHPIPPKK